MQTLTCLLITVLLANGIWLLVSREKKENDSILENSNMSMKTLQRSRRYLIFTKGDALFVQGNIAKSVLGFTPRGLNEITEFTLSYELPSSVEAFAPKYKIHRKQVSATTETPTKSMTWHVPKIYHKYPTYPWYTYNPHHGRYYDNLDGSRKSKPQRFMRAASAEEIKLRKQKETPNILMDLLTKWAELYAYQPRYCIMRTLCELRHILVPKGVSLFHDILRILIKYAEPSIITNSQFSSAYVEYKTLEECATFYGPHCRSSFVHHFTKILGE